MRPNGETPGMTEEYYIAPEDLTVFHDESNNLNVRVKGRGEWAKVVVRLACPYSDPEHFVGLLHDGEQIGMIRDLSDLTEDSRALLKQALTKRYHIPEVARILSVRETSNAAVWTVATDKGRREFMVRGRHNFRRIKGRDLIIVDVDGNRFRVRRGVPLDRESQKLLDLHA